jgi:arginine decarboxylase
MNTLSLENFILRAGVGRGLYKSTAFDRALVEAGVSNYNLIKVSSVLPPNCMQNNIITLAQGLLLPSAFAAIYSKNIGDVVSAAVAIGVPKNNTDIGVIMKHSAIVRQGKTEMVARQLAEQAMVDRSIAILEIISTSIECTVESNEIYCAFATVSMW